MTTKKLTSAIITARQLVGCVASLILIAILSVGCARELDPNSDDELDWSKRGEVTLKSVSIAAGGVTKAGGETPMPVGYRFRMYVMAKGSQQIVETRTYTIATTEGVPVMDADQKPLYLPYGNLDVYLVGPLNKVVPSYTYDDADGNAVVVPEQITPIAKEDGVEPQLGVDLVASRTAIKVLASTGNNIAANALEHKMSQLDITISRFKSEQGEAVYEHMEMDYISIDHVAISGAFTFDEKGGTVTPTGPLTNIHFSGSQIEVTENNGQKEKFRVLQIVMPRPAHKAKIETQFSYNLVGESTTNKLTRVFSGMTSETAFAPGVCMQYSSMPILGVDLVFRPTVLPWDDEGTTVVELPGLNPELAAWYSGADAPEDIYGDGKMYWRDRSGNGNHALITSGIHNADGKYYYPAPGYDAAFIVPPLWDTPNTDYTIEFAAQTISATAAKRAERCLGLNAVSFYEKGLEGELDADMSVARIDLPYGYMMFRSGDRTVPEIYFTGGTDNNPTDTELYEQFHTYAFSRTAGKGYVFVNGKLQHMQPMVYEWKAFNGTKNLLWKPADLKAPYNKDVRLYEVKIFKSCKKTDNGTEDFGAVNAELQTNYTNYVSRVGKTNVQKDEYVKDGLIVDLRAEDITADGATWSDRSGQGNNFVKVGTDLVATAKGRYQFFYDKNSYLKSTKPLGTLENFTVEVVAKSNVANYSSVCLFSAYESSKLPTAGHTSVYWPNNMKMTLNIAGGQMNIPYASLTNGDYGTASSVCFQRSDNEILVWQSGAKPVNVARAFGTIDLQAWNFVTIGSPRSISENYNGWVYAVRIYNRALSDAERQHNYLIDKEKYNLQGYKR